MTTLYETDFSAWIKEQAELLRKKDFQNLDLNNLIEEVVDMGIAEKRAVQSHLLNLLVHLIKQHVQPEKSSKSWDDSITAARAQIKLYTDDSRILKRHLEEVYEKTFHKAREAACKEMRLESRGISTTFPWSLRQALGE